MKKFITAVFVCLASFTFSQNITNTPFGKGLINVFAKAYVRRARIKGSGNVFSPKVSYKFEYDVANGYVLDAVLKWNFAGNWTVWFGQTKLPGNIERVFSSQKLQLVDRSLLNSRFTLDSN